MVASESFVWTILYVSIGLLSIFLISQSTYLLQQAERDHYSQFVTEDFDAYVNRKRRSKCFGNNVEIQAMSELYNRPIEVYTDEPSMLL